MMRFKWINIWMICLLLVGHSMIVSAQFQDKEERLAYLELAGDSLIQLYMPKQDVGVVSESYLQENLEYALRAFAESPWFHSVPDSIFLNDILPYSSIGEEVDAWRPLFYQYFSERVKEYATITEAAECLNREIWSVLGVTYSPKRDKPDQSPFHSMRIGIASCTGLSILLVDACRSVGIPARFAGCNWKHKPGNHSWVEIWDNGTWHHLGAEDAPKVNQAWFNADVIYADPNDPQYAIYATSWNPTGTNFYGTWCESTQTAVPAYNVTERYLQNIFTDPIPRLSISVVDQDGVRSKTPLYVVDATTHNEVARGVSHDDTFDLNHHFNFSMPKGSEVKIYTDKDYKELIGTYRFGDDDYVLIITL